MPTSQITPPARLDAAVRPARGAAFLRRTLDVAIAGIILVLMVPTLVVIALAIQLDSGGPVIFRQRRIGNRLDEFTLYKFRTMAVGADPTPHSRYVAELINSPPPASEQGLYKLTNDTRVTAVGRYLRKSSLDELPQLWNVLRGEMSLVGPRPVVSYEVEHYPPWFMQRFTVKPGLTGLWQVSGRGQKTYEDMVRLDVEYVTRQSLALDLLILLKTPMATFRRGTA